MAISSPVIAHSSTASVSSPTTADTVTQPSLTASPILQSQARALLPTDLILPAISPMSQLSDDPTPRRPTTNAPLSQCHSPAAHTGATRKRRIILELPDNCSPMFKRLRSYKTHH